MPDPVGVGDQKIPVHEFWTKRCYEPFQKDDDPDAKPFWHLWASNIFETQHRLVVPDAKVDPEDEGFVRYNRDMGSQSKANIFCARKSKKHKRYQETRLAQLAEQAKKPLIQPPPNPNRPKINMFIRCVDLQGHSDIRQIVDIYNHYINNSVSVQETEQMSSHQMRHRLTDILDCRMPVIVAVEKKSSKVRFAGEHSVPGETIIGFAYVDELGAQHTMNQFSGDLEVYVAPSYETKGVGKNLLDRALFCLDSNYDLKGGCEWNGGEDWHHGGGRRLLRNVLCHMPYATEDKNRLAWVGGFLERFGFEKVGDLPNTGVKLGHE